MLIDYYPNRNRIHAYPRLDGDVFPIELVPNEASFSTRAAFDGPAAYWPDEAKVVIYDWHGVWGVNMMESELYWFYRSDLVPLSADPPSFSHRMF